MLDFARQRNFRFKTADQEWIQEWFSPAAAKRAHKRHLTPRATIPGWMVLNDQLYNARPWWHPKLKSYDPADEPRIWHWHGYKPVDVQCWLRAIRTGSWPERSWHDTEANCTRGRCRYTPILGSGCRHFSILKPRPCFLRSYTHLLAQHRRLLHIADLANPLTAPSKQI